MIPDSDTRPLPFRFGQVLGICDTLETLLGFEEEPRFKRMHANVVELKTRLDALSADCMEHKRKLDDYERAERFEAQVVARLHTQEPCTPK